MIKQDHNRDSLSILKANHDIHIILGVMIDTFDVVYRRIRQFAFPLQYQRQVLM